MSLLSPIMMQDAVVDQIPDLQRFWIKKLVGFTVLKPIERLEVTVSTDTRDHFDVFISK